MAIEWIKEVAAGRSAKSDDSNDRHYTRQWLIRVTTATEGPLAATNSSALPVKGTYYRSSFSGVEEWDYAATLRELDVEQDSNDLYLWRCTGRYSSKFDPARTDRRGPDPGGNPNQQGNQGDESPFNKPAVKTWGTVKFQRPIERTPEEDEPIVNAVAEKFDPPVEVDDSRLVLTVVRNELVYDPVLALAYHDVVNSDQFGQFAAGLCKVESITASSQTWNGIEFWSTTYVIHIRKDGWQIHLLNQGSKYVESGEFHAFKGKDGTPLSSGLLAADGTKLDFGDEPIYFTFDPYREAAFAVFGLPI